MEDDEIYFYPKILIDSIEKILEKSNYVNVKTGGLSLENGVKYVSFYLSQTKNFSHSRGKMRFEGPLNSDLQQRFLNMIQPHLNSEGYETKYLRGEYIKISHARKYKKPSRGATTELIRN